MVHKLITGTEKDPTLMNQQLDCTCQLKTNHTPAYLAAAIPNVLS